jgi:hypothetical protein
MPTLHFGFIQDDKGKLILHQWWSLADGGEWRPVPTVSKYFDPMTTAADSPP